MKSKYQQDRGAGGLQTMGLQKVEHDSVSEHTHTHTLSANCFHFVDCALNVSASVVAQLGKNLPAIRILPNPRSQRYFPPVLF